MNVPFTAGIAPGFEIWMHNTPADRIRFREGDAPGMRPDAKVSDFRGKGFYQTIGGEGSVRGGVVRRFIGLAAGHAYRVSARLNVLEAAGNEWALSFHAVANPARITRLSASQLAGLDELPTGLKGPTAAQIARFDSTSNQGQWETRASNTSGGGNVAGDIALPAGADSITVWFRLESAEGSEATVGIDSVTLEILKGSRKE